VLSANGIELSALCVRINLRVGFHKTSKTASTG
jgi:hypothetical protein